MIYTTYFAKLNKLPNDITPISICAKVPDWYKGYQYKKLSPTYDILMTYKNTHDIETYIKRYKIEVLSKISPEFVIHDLGMLVGSVDNIALVCFEKSTDFCHRHLVADWLTLNGYETKEYKFN